MLQENDNEVLGLLYIFFGNIFGCSTHFYQLISRSWPADAVLQIIVHTRHSAHPPSPYRGTPALSWAPICTPKRGKRRYWRTSLADRRVFVGRPLFHHNRSFFSLDTLQSPGFDFSDLYSVLDILPSSNMRKSTSPGEGTSKLSKSPGSSPHSVPRSPTGSPQEQGGEGGGEPEVDDDAGSDYAEDFLSDTTSINSEITAYRFENGRRYHAYKDGAYW